MTTKNNSEKALDPSEMYYEASKTLGRWLEISSKGKVSAEDYRLMKRVAFFMGIHCSLSELDLAYARFIKETGSAQMYPLFGGSRRQELLWSKVMSSFDDLQQWLSHGARANLFREARTCYTDYEEWRLLQA